MENPSAAPSERRRRRWLAILLKTLVVLAAVFALLWFGIPPRVPTKPIRLVRNEKGLLVPVAPMERPSFFSFEIQAGAIIANDSSGSSSVTSSANRSGFACGRLAIMNRSDHLLMARVGKLLLDEFKTLGYVRQIGYYPAGFNPEQGELAPDITISIDLDNLVESNWPAYHSVDATIAVAAGDAPGCRHSYNDHLSPPDVQFDWNGTLHHTSNTIGVNSWAAKYKLVAEDIVKQIAGSLTKEFNERREKQGAMPELPQAFYPPYRKPPALPFAEFANLQLVTSWHGLMNHDETMWRLTTARPVADVLGEIQRGLESAGWRTLDGSTTDKQNYLRMGHDAAMLAVWVPTPAPKSPIFDIQTLLEASPNESVHNVEPSPSFLPKESIVNIHYVDRMTRDEVRAAVDESLAQNASTDVLVFFEQVWSDDQCRRILKELESRPVRTPQTAMTLADLYHRFGKDDIARGKLLQLRVLLRTISQYSDLENRARSLAKDLGDEDLAKKPIEPRELDELGFTELKPGVSVPAQEIGLEEPIHFYTKASDSSLKTISLRAVRSIPNKGPDKDEVSYDLAFVESGEHGRSWGTGGTSHGFSTVDGYNASFTLNRLGAGERFRLTALVSGQ